MYQKPQIAPRINTFVGADNAAMKNLNPRGKSAAKKKPNVISPIVANDQTIGNFTAVVITEPITEMEAMVKDRCPHELDAQSGARPGDSLANLMVN